MSSGKTPIKGILIAALAATAPAAWLFLRAGGLVDGAADPVAAIASVPGDLLPAIARDPLALPTGPAALMGALLGATLPWVAAMLAIAAGSTNTRVGEEHGSARWATPEEIRPYGYAKNPDPEYGRLILSEHASLAVSRTDFVKQYDRNQNVLVLGGSGSGKTRYYVKPNVLQMNCDYFITDPKGDLYGEVKPMLEAAGYKVELFDTFLTERSLVYNPLRYLDTDSEVMTFAKLFIKMTNGTQKGSSDPFWEKSETMLYMALIAFLRDYMPPEDYNIGGLLTLLGMAEVHEEDEGYESPLDLTFREIETGVKRVRRHGRAASRAPEGAEETVFSGQADEMETVASGLVRRDGVRPGKLRADGTRGVRPEDDFALQNYKKFKSAAGKTLKSILISCNVRLAPFTAREVASITCANDQMDLVDMGEDDRPRAIFNVFRDTDRTLGFLHGLMVYQSIYYLCEKALRKHGGKLPRPVHFMLDEYRSLNLPQDISGLISVVRSRNIGMSIILQGVSQLGELYEEKAAASIMACCDTMLFLGAGFDKETPKLVSDACGQQTVYDTNYSSSHGGQGSWSKSGNKIARPLIDAAEVLKLPQTECIVIIKGAPGPLLDNKYPLERHPRYHLLKDNPPTDTSPEGAASAPGDGPAAPARGRKARGSAGASDAPEPDRGKGTRK